MPQADFSNPFTTCHGVRTCRKAKNGMRVIMIVKIVEKLLK